MVHLERIHAAGASAVARVDGPPELLADASRGLPQGAARAEAMAARLERDGVAIAERRRPVAVGELLAHCRARGGSSVELLRAAPGIETRLEIGTWFDAGPRRRLLRRVLARVPLLPLAGAARLGARAASLAAETAFWQGARRAANDSEWRRLTRSSYVVLYYHRLAGENKPGQERFDLPPSQFARHVRLLRRLGFRPLAAEDLLRFHDGSLPVLPRRGYVITADDGFLDCVEPFLDHAAVQPQLFVPTAEVGGRSWWAGDEPLAGWSDLRRLADAGVGVGSHGQRHVALPELDDASLGAELAASRQDLERELPATIPVLAYPHGRRDPRVQAAAAATGFRLAFTTDPGRNGAGTDPLALRRIGPKAWDSRISFMWKVLTGRLLPERWEARRLRRDPP